MPRGEPLPKLPEEIVATPEELTACCDRLAACTLIGFDTEFVGEETYHPHLCLVQVATPERLYLIDPLTCGPLDRFWELVVDPARRVVVHAGREEVRLCHLCTGKTPGNLADLQIAAGMVGMVYPLGHGGLVSQLLGIHLHKLETLTEWRERPLTRQQVRYAFDDVRFLLPLWEKLESRLQQLDRLPWAEEEFTRLKTHATADEAVTEKWRKLRGIGALDRSRLAVVRELYRWRDELAEKLNRPARVLVRDDLLIEIARRNPRQERDLVVIRGLAHRNLPAILEAVERGRAIPPDQHPEMSERDQDPPQVTLVVNILSAVLGDFCVRRELASTIAATSNDLKQLVRAQRRGEPIPTTSLLSQGWRAAHVLPELQAVVQGRRAIRIADIRADAPLAVEGERGA